MKPTEVYNRLLYANSSQGLQDFEQTGNLVSYQLLWNCPHLLGNDMNIAELAIYNLLMIKIYKYTTYLTHWSGWDM